MTTAIERVEAAFRATDTEGFTPAIEQVFMDDLPAVLARNRVDEDERYALTQAISVLRDVEGSGNDTLAATLERLLERLTGADL